MAAPTLCPPLLTVLQQLIERTYDLDTQGLDAGSFVIGDGGLAALYSDRHAHERDLRTPGSAMLLLRADGDVHHLRVYYPDRLIRNLELHDPRRGLTPRNLVDFGTLVEELDHLLLVASAWQSGRPVRGVELELHANVTKMLVASLFLARTLGVERLGRHHRSRLLFHLLERGDFEGEQPPLRERYLTARRAAVLFLDRLQRTPLRERQSLLRRFSRAPFPDKLRLSA